jgi:hypothetical protein
MHWWRRLQDVVLESLFFLKQIVLIFLKKFFLNLAKLFKKKAPKKGRKKRKQGARTKVQESKKSNKGMPQGGKGTTKNQTLQFC